MEHGQIIESFSQLQLGDKMEMLHEFLGV